MIAEKVGVSASTVGRWRTGEIDPKPRQVAAFARAYGKSPLAALVAAGYLSEEDLEGDLTLGLASDLDEVSTLQMIDELRRRFEAMNDYLGWIRSIGRGVGHPAILSTGAVRYVDPAMAPAEADPQPFVDVLSQYLTESVEDGTTFYQLAAEYQSTAEDDVPLHDLEKMRAHKRSSVRPLDDDLDAVARPRDPESGEDS